MAYIVSARKYRPKTFDEVVGQHAVTNILKKAIEQKRLAQALLFTGPRGVGKTSCARIMAREVNKEFLDDPDQDLSFNIFELDAASNNSVDDIRELIEQVRIPPQVAKYKVYIIDEVHMLSNQAFNAFLKTLEEPPEHAIFILATTEKHKIPATILSRCQIFDFKRISITDIKNHLKKIAQWEDIEADEDALYLIARKADGALRDALSAFDKIVSLGEEKITRSLVANHLGILDFDIYFDIIDLIHKRDITALLQYFNKLVTEGVDIHFFIGGLTSHFRDLLIAKHPETIALLEQSDEIKQRYKAQAGYFDEETLTSAIDILVQADLDYKMSQNPLLLTELGLLKILNSIKDYKKKTLTANPNSGLPKVNEFQPLISGKVEEKKEVYTSTGNDESKDMSTQPESEAEEISGQDNREKINEHSQNKTVNTTASSDSPTPPNTKKNTSILGLNILKQKPVKKEQTKLNEDFTQEDLLGAWQEFVSILNQNGETRLAALLAHTEPDLQEKNIILEFDNTLTIKEFNSISKRLLHFLQDKLQNHFIQFKIIKTEPKQEQQIIYYSKSERIRRLIEINPVIKDLIQKLKLE